MQLQKHIARVTSTDERLVVVYMQLPEAANYALVISPDHLPPRFEQVVRSVLESPEGQAERDLANILGRRMFEDTGVSIMQALHSRGFLSRMPVSNITMYPAPGMPIPLSNLIKQMTGSAPTNHTADELPAERFNPHVNNSKADASSETAGLANGLLMEASLLEEEAQRKREQAYGYAPHLRPAPVTSADATRAANAALFDTPAAEGSATL
jgi:hypothetical protein